MSGDKRPVQRARGVCIEVIHDQRDALRIRGARGDDLHEHRPVEFGPALGDLGQSPPGQPLAGQKDVALAAASVFVVMAPGPPVRRGNKFAGLANQPPVRLVHAPHEVLCAVDQCGLAQSKKNASIIWPDPPGFSVFILRGLLPPWPSFSTA